METENRIWNQRLQKMRASQMRKMDKLIRSINDEEVCFGSWLMCGVPDGTRTDEDFMDLAEDIDGYLDIAREFVSCMQDVVSACSRKGIYEFAYDSDRDEQSRPGLFIDDWNQFRSFCYGLYCRINGGIDYKEFLRDIYVDDEFMSEMLTDEDDTGELFDVYDLDPLEGIE